MKLTEDTIVVTCVTENYGGFAGKWSVCQVKECGVKVWLSDSTVASINKMHPQLDVQKRPLVIICIDCMLKTVQTHKETIDFEIMPMTDIQKKEMEEAIIRLRNKPN